MKRLRNLFWLAAAALIVAGCASATLTKLAYANAALAYSNLGPMLTWMVDDYVDLSGVQEDWVRGRVDRLVEWHRTEELPRYRRFLESALAKAEGPFTAEDVAEHQRELRMRVRRLVVQVIPDMAEFLAGIEGEQAVQLERKFAEENRKYVRESTRGTPDERRDRRVRRFGDHLEAWVGPLTDAQRALIAEHYRGLPDIGDEILAERRYRQVEILALVRARTSKEALAPELQRLFVEMETWRRPEFAQKLRARDQRGYEMLAALSATMTDQQRTALQKRIRGFIRDIGKVTAPA